MSEQVQCPHCGGYKVSTETVLIDRKSGQRVQSGCGFLIFVFLGLFVALFLLVASDAALLSWLGVGSALILLPFAILDEAHYRKADKIDKYFHTCQLCGYEWRRRADEPLPQVTEGPDLVAKGAQRLEEERQRWEKEYREAGMWMKK